MGGLFFCCLSDSLTPLNTTSSQPMYTVFMAEKALLFPFQNYCLIILPLGLKDFKGQRLPYWLLSAMGAIKNPDNQQMLVA